MHSTHGRPRHVHRFHPAPCSRRAGSSRLIPSTSAARHRPWGRPNPTKHGKNVRCVCQLAVFAAGRKCALIYSSTDTRTRGPTDTTKYLTCSLVLGLGSFSSISGRSSCHDGSPERHRSHAAQTKPEASNTAHQKTPPGPERRALCSSVQCVWCLEPAGLNSKGPTHV